MVGAENYKVYGNISDSSLIKVYDLIDHSCRYWNMGLIRSTVEESVADKILRIPLGWLEHEDIVVWRGEPSEAFSMRSAYKLLLDSNRDSQFTVLQNATKGFYRKLWNLSLTARQKITTWKISWNFLPTLVNLYHRRIEVQLACPRCGNME